MKAEPDSGEDVNIMDEHEFKAFQNRCDKKVHLEPTNTKLNTLQSELPVETEFETTLRNKTRGEQTKFLVVEGRIHSPPLLSKKTLMDAGMLEIREDGSFADKNNLRIHSTEVRKVAELSEIEKIVKKHDKVFKGVGHIRDVKKNEDNYAQFSMKPEAVPVPKIPRPVPYYLQKPLKQWIDQSIEEDLFEKVPDGEAITWCPPIDVQYHRIVI